MNIARAEAPNLEEMPTAVGSRPALEITEPDAQTNPELRVLESRQDAQRVLAERDAGAWPRIDRYQLLGRFPSAASADVFLAVTEPELGMHERVVLKWADPRRKDFALIEAALLDEARAMRGAEHPNVVAVRALRTGRIDGSFFVMPYIAGTDLRRIAAELYRRGGQMPVRHALFILMELLRALQAVHTAVNASGAPMNIVHRDVNPTNVLIDKTGHVLLTDFGAAHMADRLQSDTGHGLVKGKVRYLAPEYIIEQSCDARADLYGVGVLFYELISGHPAFQAEHKTATMLRIVQDGLNLQPLLKQGLDPDLVRLLGRTISRDPSARFQTADALLVALERWTAEKGVYLSATQLRAYLKAESLYR